MSMSRSIVMTCWPKDPGRDEPAIKRLADLVTAHEVENIAIGNGTACRETQALVRLDEVLFEVSG